MRLGRCAVVIGAVTIVSACVLFPDLSVISNDASSADGALVDATIDAPVLPDAGGFDALADAALIDSSFCQTSDATYCDDFDTVSLAVRWSSRYLKSGGVVDHDAFDAAPSLPNTLLAAIPSAVDAASIQATRAAYVVQSFPGKPLHFELSFWISIVAADTGNAYGAVLPFDIVVPDVSDTGFHSIAVYQYAQRAYAYELDQFADGGTFARQFPDLFDAPKLGIPSHFAIAIDRA